MTPDFSCIKERILLETINERKEFQAIYERSCQKARKSSRVKKLILLFCIGLCLYLFRMAYYKIDPAVTVIVGVVLFIICIPFIGMSLEGDISFYDDALSDILKKDKDYYPLEKVILEKKRQIMRNDEEFVQYLFYLKEKVMVTVLGRNYLSFVELFGNDDNNETADKKQKLLERLEKIFVDYEFLFFNSDYSGLEFYFQFSYDGKSLLGTRASTTLSLNDEDVINGTISYKSWENCW